MNPNDDAHVANVEYDPESDAYYASFDPETVSATTAVIESVAAVLRTEPLEIDPLYRFVDTDALDALVDAGPRKESPSLSTSFRYMDADVTVRAEGTVVVEPDDAP